MSINKEQDSYTSFDQRIKNIKSYIEEIRDDLEDLKKDDNVDQIKRLSKDEMDDNLNSDGSYNIDRRRDNEMYKSNQSETNPQISSVNTQDLINKMSYTLNKNRGNEFENESETYVLSSNNMNNLNNQKLNYDYNKNFESDELKRSDEGYNRIEENQYENDYQNEIEEINNFKGSEELNYNYDQRNETDGEIRTENQYNSKINHGNNFQNEQNNNNYYYNQNEYNQYEQSGNENDEDGEIIINKHYNNNVKSNRSNVELDDNLRKNNFPSNRISNIDYNENQIKDERVLRNQINNNQRNENNIKYSKYDQESNSNPTSRFTNNNEFTQSIRTREYENKTNDYLLNDNFKKYQNSYQLDNNKLQNNYELKQKIATPQKYDHVNSVNENYSYKINEKLKEKQKIELNYDYAKKYPEKQNYNEYQEIIQNKLQSIEKDELLSKIAKEKNRLNYQEEKAPFRENSNYINSPSFPPLNKIERNEKSEEDFSQINIPQLNYNYGRNSVNNNNNEIHSLGEIESQEKSRYYTPTQYNVLNTNPLPLSNNILNDKTIELERQIAELHVKINELQKGNLLLQMQLSQQNNKSNSNFPTQDINKEKSLNNKNTEKNFSYVKPNTPLKDTKNTQNLNDNDKSFINDLASMLGANSKEEILGKIKEIEYKHKKYTKLENFAKKIHDLYSSIYDLKEKKLSIKVLWRWIKGVIKILPSQNKNSTLYHEVCTALMKNFNLKDNDELTNFVNDLINSNLNHENQN